MNSRLSTAVVALILGSSALVSLAALMDIIRPNELGLMVGAVAASSLAYLSFISPRRDENSFLGYTVIFCIGIGATLTSARAVLVGPYVTRVHSFGYVVLLLLTVGLFVAMLSFSGDADEVIDSRVPYWFDPNVTIRDVFKEECPEREEYEVHEADDPRESDE